ncbi:serine-threonine kinase [Orpheovirus IHUMI-LCC2]|uniref:Cyclin-dependent kinase n=1 Tax=Orpheovirus IHUMI-LCC2 TaxID=2023057 RepID=A0A2I2L4W4_9VIRU|nr:serine-threonine kinase [Orpheovirus IHUMI-LCC2]SNW62499.1 Cyclin-dependent kinase [Orpheovirus IHUMI-LCC2]
MDKYTKLSTIASGVYGRVCKYKNNITNEICCIKKIYLDDIHSFLREISNTRRCSHPNIIKIKEIIIETYPDGKLEGLYIVMPYIEMTLAQVIRKNKLTDTQIIEYCLQLLSAVNHIHNNNIYHRDLKPDNILIQGNKLYVCDFGVSRNVLDSKKMTNIVQAAYYRSPEILLHCKKYDEKIDMWSVGCIIAEMINGMVLFSDSSEIGLLYKIFNCMGTPSDDFLKKHDTKGNFPRYSARHISNFIFTTNKLLLDLCKGLLCVDPDNRLSSYQAIQIIDSNYPITYPLYSYETSKCKIIQGSDITLRIRKILYDWLFEVKMVKALSIITLLNAYNIFDKYSSICKINKNECQLYGMVALYLSSLIHDVYYIDDNDCIEVTDNTYNMKQFYVAVNNILTTLNYEIDITSLSMYSISREKLDNITLLVYYVTISPEFYTFFYSEISEVLEIFYSTYMLWKEEKLNKTIFTRMFNKYLINIKCLPNDIKTSPIFLFAQEGEVDIYNYVTFISNML